MITLLSYCDGGLPGPWQWSSRRPELLPQSFPYGYRWCCSGLVVVDCCSGPSFDAGINVIYMGIPASPVIDFCQDCRCAVVVADPPSFVVLSVSIVPLAP